MLNYCDWAKSGNNWGVIIYINLIKCFIYYGNFKDKCFQCMFEVPALNTVYGLMFQDPIVAQRLNRIFSHLWFQKGQKC